MSDKSDEQYQVGYGKPPKSTRFKKGKSGNPGGRPKRTAQNVDPGKTLQLIDNEEIVVTVNGKRKSMLKAEVFFRQLFAKAIKGDLTAARLVTKMAADYFGPEADGPSEARFIVMPPSYWENFQRNS